LEEYAPTFLIAWNSALARALGRQYRRTHADVAALKKGGLGDRSQGEVRATADRITADIRF